MKNKIIVPADFTKASILAVKQAVIIAARAGSSVTLLHVLNDMSSSHEEVTGQLNAEAGTISEQSGIDCNVLIKEGNIFDMIVHTVCEKDYDLMVIGTHGYSGIKQMLFGTDILKLVAKIPIPVLVMQEESPLVESFDKIVLPVGSHDTFQQAVEAVLLFAKIYDIEVHLYSIYKPGFEWTKQVLANIEEATRRFDEQGVRMIRVKEEQEGFSQGYARQTLKYARSVGADAIWMMAVASQEYHSLAKAYKEAMLSNEYRIPMLSAGGGEGV